MRERYNMAEYMHLIGTEQIQSAANTMKSAAIEMHRAANLIDESLRRHEVMMAEFMLCIAAMGEGGHT